MKRACRSGAICLFLLTLGGCFSARVPMRTLEYVTPGDVTGKDLLLFFPGRGGDYTDFERQGFIADLRSRFPTADAVCLDAGLGYYRKRTLDERVKQDILDPWPIERYRRVYLVGVSMGGLGAVLTARKYPQNIEAILLISPFLGWDGILDEIESAGGVRAWKPGAYTEEDWQRMIWHLLKQTEEREDALPPIYLAYGTEDRWGKAHRLLRDILPAGKIVTHPGGHENPTFKKLWRELLDSLPAP